MYILQNVGWGFCFCFTPTRGSVGRPHWIKMSSRSVMSSKEAGNNPGSSCYFLPLNQAAY